MLAIPAVSTPLGGIRYLAAGGHAFYQTDNGLPVIAFNPNMTARTRMGAAERNNVRTEAVAGKR
ncbi:hypothetical protein BLA13014_04775 [Burkholderia aenigmatica]|uniref:Uncharacterized protein n=1 Tax=Burkholderia aenigmatica TaxID=2015348 RepID=A0A6P2P3V7_9BURK|nr:MULTISPECIES: hypothetical protein [Burkholderia]VWC01877.1 hypothetical protein BLA13014_04775 [Burkholderia aenigmatica]